MYSAVQNGKVEGSTEDTRNIEVLSLGLFLRRALLYLRPVHRHGDNGVQRRLTNRIS